MEVNVWNMMALKQSMLILPQNFPQTLHSLKYVPWVPRLFVFMFKDTRKTQSLPEVSICLPKRTSIVWREIHPCLWICLWISANLVPVLSPKQAADVEETHPLLSKVTKGLCAESKLLASGSHLHLPPFTRGFSFIGETLRTSPVGIFLKRKPLPRKTSMGVIPVPVLSSCSLGISWVKQEHSVLLLSPRQFPSEISILLKMPLGNMLLNIVSSTGLRTMGRTNLWTYLLVSFLISWDGKTNPEVDLTVPWLEFQIK